MHKISDEQLDNYLTGKGSPEERARLEAHVAGCPECWEKYQRESPVMRALDTALLEAGERLSVDPQEVHTRFADVMASLRHSTDADAQMDRSLNMLESVLEPVLGKPTVQRAMFLAAFSPSVNPVGRISKDNWDSFLERLANIAAILCGDLFARLIREQRQVAPAAAL